MARLHHRIFALVGALLFLGSTVAITAGILWQMHQDNQTKQQTSQTNQGATLEGSTLQNFTPINKIDQLQVVDLQQGTGEVVKVGATVTAHYTGAIASTGIIFQSSHDGQNQPIPFKLIKVKDSPDGRGVIDGWVDGVAGMKVGGTRRLLIPASLAYGDQSPAPNIPANSDLVFDIELVAVQNP